MSLHCLIHDHTLDEPHLAREKALYDKLGPYLRSIGYGGWFWSGPNSASERPVLTFWAFCQDYLPSHRNTPEREIDRDDATGIKAAKDYLGKRRGFRDGEHWESEMRMQSMRF